MKKRIYIILALIMVYSLIIGANAKPLESKAKQINLGANFEALIASENDGKYFDDGLFKLSSESNIYWLLNTVHGLPTGHLSLQWNNHWYRLKPSELRNLVANLTGIKISNDEALMIIPCYPEAVRNLYEDELKQNNIIVRGNWNSKSYFMCLSDGICYVSDEEKSVHVDLFEK